MRKIFAAILTCCLLATSGCASLRTPAGDIDSSKLLTRADTVINTLTWTRAVTDTVFGAGCSSGTFNPSLCTAYDLTSKAAGVGLNASRHALENYKTTGNALNEEILMSTIGDLVPLVLKFDQIYKNPASEEVLR